MIYFAAASRWPDLRRRRHRHTAALRCGTCHRLAPAQAARRSAWRAATTLAIATGDGVIASAEPGAVAFGCATPAKPGPSGPPTRRPRGVCATWPTERSSTRSGSAIRASTSSACWSALDGASVSLLDGRTPRWRRGSIHEVARRPFAAVIGLLLEMMGRPRRSDRHRSRKAPPAVQLRPELENGCQLGRVAGFKVQVVVHRPPLQATSRAKPDHAQARTDP